MERLEEEGEVEEEDVGRGVVVGGGGGGGSCGCGCGGRGGRGRLPQHVSLKTVRSSPACRPKDEEVVEESVSASAVHSQVRSRGGGGAARLRGLYLPRHRHTLFIRAPTFKRAHQQEISVEIFTSTPLLLSPPPPPSLVVVGRMLTCDTRDQEVGQGSVFWKGWAGSGPRTATASGGAVRSTSQLGIVFH